MDNKFEINFYGKKRIITLGLGLYSVIDFMGNEMHNIGIILFENGKQYNVLTTCFGEFIGVKNAAYIDTNNCPYADQILEKIGTKTTFTKASGFCEYPLWKIDESFLKSLDEKLYKKYSDEYDNYMRSFNCYDESDDLENEKDTPKNLYRVVYRETLVHTCDVEADSEEAAIDEFNAMISRGEFDFSEGVLDDSTISAEIVSDETGAICPKCGNYYTERPAISREPGGAEICPDCGMKEALAAYIAGGRADE